MFKKAFSIILAVTISLLCVLPASASETSDNYEYIEFPQEIYLPNDGIEHFSTEYRTPSLNSNNEGYTTYSNFITVYGFDYTKGPIKYGAWRNGASGGSNTSDMTITFDCKSDKSYNISFTASVSGSYTPGNGATIGNALGVNLGFSKTYTLGAGSSVPVPKGEHYLIQYRPVYYTYTVVETTYKEWPLLNYRYVECTRTCYVDVFSHWDFTVVDAPSD